MGEVTPTVSIEVAATSRFFGIGRPNASARATAMDVASGKRVEGSLAILRRITADRAGGIFGLIKAGAGGIVLICCIIISVGLSLLNGSLPVQISKRMIPRE